MSCHFILRWATGDLKYRGEIHTNFLNIAPLSSSGKGQRFFRKKERFPQEDYKDTQRKGMELLKLSRRNGEDGFGVTGAGRRGGSSQGLDSSDGALLGTDS